MIIIQTEFLKDVSVERSGKTGDTQSHWALGVTKSVSSYFSVCMDVCIVVFI